MLKSLRIIARHFYTSNYVACNVTLIPNYSVKMSDVKRIKQSRYDGRSKKRAWEERRSDKGENLGFQSKQSKLQTENPEDEKYIEKIENKNVVNEESIIPRVKRRKFVLMLGYSGVNYYGMQRNPGMNTVEEELLKALHKLEYIDQVSFDQVQNMSFQRAARTDKGVSAIRQIVSLKLPENFDFARINAQIPDDIRVFDCKRVTKGFNSKSQCDSRTYIYVLPTIAFSNQNQTIIQKDYRLSDDIFKRVNNILKLYLGTKNYHNYTSKKKPKDPSAKRYMINFECEKPFIRQDTEFAILKVRGQSFMMHQIRKMVGMLLAIVRGLTTEETIENSFGTEKVNVPRAPGLGLMLDYVHYERYNHRFGTDGMHPKLTWEEVDDKVLEFRDKQIFSTIIDKEVKEEQMIYWLHNKLSRHRYDDFENCSDDENEGDEDDDGEDKDSEVGADKTINKDVESSKDNNDSSMSCQSDNKKVSVG